MNLPIASRRTTLRKLGALLLTHRWRVAGVIISQSIAAGAGVTLPWILGQAIDQIAVGITPDYVVQMISLALGLVAVAAGFGWLGAYQGRVLGECIVADMRVDLITSLTRLPLSTVEHAGSGDLLGRATHDVTAVSRLIRSGTAMWLNVVTTVGVTTVGVLLTSPVLGVVLLSGAPVMVLGVRWYLNRAIPAYRTLVAGIATTAGLVTETIEQGETVDALRLAAVRKGRFHAVMAEMWRVDRYSAWMRVFLFMVLVTTTLLPLIVVVGVGALMMPSGLVTAGQVSAVALMGYQMRGSVWQATYLVDEFLTILVSMQRIVGVDEVQPDRVATVDYAPSNPIHAQGVSYAYRPGCPVLHDVSLALNPGERLAIVGPSGAGKSTFGRMLAGIHPPTTGTVCVGEVPLVDLTEDALRSHVVLVTQEHHVFVGTVADNVRLAKQTAGGVVPDAKIQAALAAVGAWEWVTALDDGMDTLIGAGGVELTPAQAQQLALARIIVMDPHTVVLDEATSLLDAGAARSLEQSLESLLEGRTVVAIAHRLHTAHDADRVAVMMDGCIVELGTHDELVAAGGEYAALWASWTAT